KGNLVRGVLSTRHCHGSSLSSPLPDGQEAKESELRMAHCQVRRTSGSSSGLFNFLRVISQCEVLAARSSHKRSRRIVMRMQWRLALMALGLSYLTSTAYAEPDAKPGTERDAERRASPQNRVRNEEGRQERAEGRNVRPKLSTSR